jgi:hypothetical protein
MFQAEHFVEGHDNAAVIEGCKPKVLADLLEFIYTDSLEPQKYKSIEMLLLADLYNVKKLRLNCERALSRTITCHNVIDLLCTASAISASILRRSTAKYILAHRRRIVGSAAWDDMVMKNPQVMDEIFKFGF